MALDPVRAATRAAHGGRLVLAPAIARAMRAPLSPVRTVHGKLAALRRWAERAGTAPRAQPRFAAQL